MLTTIRCTFRETDFCYKAIFNENKMSLNCCGQWCWCLSLQRSVTKIIWFHQSDIHTNLSIQTIDRDESEKYKKARNNHLKSMIEVKRTNEWNPADREWRKKYLIHFKSLTEVQRIFFVNRKISKCFFDHFFNLKSNLVKL